LIKFGTSTYEINTHYECRLPKFSSSVDTGRWFSCFCLIF